MSQDYLNITSGDVISYNELISLYLEADVFNACATGRLTPLRLCRQDCMTSRFEIAEIPVTVQDGRAKMDAGAAALLVFSLKEVGRWEASWLRVAGIESDPIPDPASLSELRRMQLVARHYKDMSDRLKEELISTRTSLSKWKKQARNFAVASVCSDDENESNAAQSEQEQGSLPENAFEAAYAKVKALGLPLGCSLIEHVCASRLAKIPPECISGKLCESPYRIPAAAARLFAVSDAELFEDIEALARKGKTEQASINNARTTKGSELYKLYKKTVANSKNCVRQDEADSNPNLANPL